MGVIEDHRAITAYLAAYGLEPVRDSPEWRVEGDNGCVIRVLLVPQDFHGEPWGSFDLLIHTSHHHPGDPFGSSARGNPWKASDGPLVDAVRDVFTALRATLNPLPG